MGIMMVTSLNTYTKGMQMKMKWQQKQAENDYTPDDKKSVDDTFQKHLDEIRYPKEDRSSQMEADIELKLNAGKRLSAEEMQYLKKHNPETYQKAKNIEREREAYEKELANCKTKEEVEQVKAAHTAVAVDRVNAIKNNPHISGEKKLELIKMEHFKAAALDDAMHIFTNTPEYKNLPSEAESQKAEKDMEEARKEELGLDEESLKEKAELARIEREAAEYEIQNQTEDTDNAGDTVQDPENSQEKKFGIPGLSDDDGEEDTILKAIQDEEARWAKEGEDVITDADGQKLTRWQLFMMEQDKKADARTEITPEMRKVQQAKARAAYSAARPDVTPTETPLIDVRK